MLPATLDLEFTVEGVTYQGTYRLVQSPWVLPVGSAEYPSNLWYCAQFHKPGVHSGLDLNVQVWPRGGIDEGQPVIAIAPGTIYSVGYSPQPAPGKGWLGCVVMKTSHLGMALWVRYGHLTQDSVHDWHVGAAVEPGVIIGRLADYRNSQNNRAAHLHFDMALDPFEWNWWLTSGVEWIDPVPVLKWNIIPDLVDSMLLEQ